MGEDEVRLTVTWLRLISVTVTPASTGYRVIGALVLHPKIGRESVQPIGGLTAVMSEREPF